MTKVYLSGKIRNIDYLSGTEWRDHATQILLDESGGKVETLDPMRNKGHLAGFTAMPRESDSIYSKADTVFTRDVWDVRQCDIVLVMLQEDAGRFTMFELGMAYALNKPIILVTNDRKRDDSISLTEGSSAIFDDLYSALDFILSLANCR
jgi:nucleoside 2-deoxyribosyltransferase